MKIFSIKILILLAWCFQYAPALAQTAFEGSITYRMTATGQGADRARASLPSLVVYHIKGKDLVAVQTGGRAPGWTRTYAADGRYLKVDTTTRQYSWYPLAYPPNTAREPDWNAATMPDTIAGYQCLNYQSILNLESQPVPIAMAVWAATALPHQLPANQITDAISAKDLEGLLLRSSTTIEVAGQTMTITMEAIAVQPGTIHLDTWTLPKGYTLAPPR